MQVEAELNALVEGDLRLPGAVHVAGVAALHGARLLVHYRLDHAVPDRLRHNELGVLGAVEQQLGGDVGEDDLAVCEADGPHGGLDHVVVQTPDQAGDEE